MLVVLIVVFVLAVDNGWYDEKEKPAVVVAPVPANTVIRSKVQRFTRRMAAGTLGTKQALL